MEDRQRIKAACFRSFREKEVKMNKHTIGDLYQMQSLPLSAKIRMTQYRIREWVDYYGDDGVYISFSGGKDSTVLLHIAREMYRNIGAIYVDTGLEYPEVREFVKQHGNVEIIKPKMNFRQIIIKYGYPMIGKEVAACVYGARRYLEKLAEQEKRAGNGEIIPNYSYMADLVGIDRREDKGNTAYRSLSRGRYRVRRLRCLSVTLSCRGNIYIKRMGWKHRNIPKCITRRGTSSSWMRLLRYQTIAAPL